MLKRLRFAVRNYIQVKWQKPIGGSLYVYDGAEMPYVIAGLFTQFMARVFPPTWIYEVWYRSPGLTDYVGGETFMHCLSMRTAEIQVARLKRSGYIAGWTQHRLHTRPI
jgi:hypothetical protein